jgi:hypothetical protein
MAKPLPDQIFPALKGVSAAHPYHAIHQWLCNVFGAHPNDLVVTDPQQNFRPVVDLEPLMRILGGEWAEAVDRCYRTKKQVTEGSNLRGIQTEGEEGSFLAGLGKMIKGKPKAPEGAKEFKRSADIAADVSAAAADAGVDVVPPDPAVIARQAAERIKAEQDKRRTRTKYLIKKENGVMCRCGQCSCNLFVTDDNDDIECSQCGDKTPRTMMPANYTMEQVA